MKIYHNPRCRKSRETLEILTQKGIEPEIILYLENTISEEELNKILKKLKVSASDIIRKGEAIYKEKFKGKKMTEGQWIKAMIKYPKLMERPIVVKGNRAVIGRPPENVNALI